MDLNLNSETVERIAGQIGTTADKVFPLLSDYMHATGVANVGALLIAAAGAACTVALAAAVHRRVTGTANDGAQLLTLFVGIISAAIVGVALPQILPPLLCPDGAAAYRCIELLAR